MLRFFERRIIILGLENEEACGIILYRALPTSIARLAYFLRGKLWIRKMWQ